MYLSLRYLPYNKGKSKEFQLKPSLRALDYEHHCTHNDCIHQESMPQKRLDSCSNAVSDLDFCHHIESRSRTPCAKAISGLIRLSTR